MADDDDLIDWGHRIKKALETATAERRERLLGELQRWEQNMANRADYECKNCHAVFDDLDFDYATCPDCGGEMKLIEP